MSLQSAAQKAGTTPENLQAFLDAVQALNAEWVPILREGVPQLSGYEAQMLYGNGGSPVDAKELYADYDAAIYQLADEFGVTLKSTTSDGRVSHLDIGSLGSPEFPNAGGRGTTGQWFAPERRGNNFTDFVEDAVTAIVTNTNPLGQAIGGLLGDGIFSTVAGSVVNNQTNDYINDRNDQLGITGTQWHGTMNDLGETEPLDISSPLEGLFGNGSIINIPIPGLPFPIPGNMTWEDLVEIARRTGQTVVDVYNDLIKPDTEVSEEGDLLGAPINDDSGDEPSIFDVPVTGGSEGNPYVSGDPVGDSEERQLVTGQPIWWEGGSLPGIDAPVEIPSDNAQDTPVPPLQGDISQDTPSLDSGDSYDPSILLPFLVPYLNEDKRDPLTGNMTYQGPDDSWGWERPDYGTPDMAPLYSFSPQPNQPTPVDYNRLPRNEYLNVLLQEQKRRQERGLL